MVHGDDNGLVLPPKIAPTELMIIPIAMHKDGVIEKAEEIENRLKPLIRVKKDVSDKSPGWKFSEYEMKGIPLRLEIGPKDIENNQCILVRRDNREKIIVSLDSLETEIPKVLQDIQDSLLNKAGEAQQAKTQIATNLEEFKNLLDEKPGFIKAMWCGDVECENKIKEFATATSRCMPFNDTEPVSDTCVCCGKKAHKLVYWGRAY